MIEVEGPKPVISQVQTYTTTCGDGRWSRNMYTALQRHAWLRSPSDVLLEDMWMVRVNTRDKEMQPRAAVKCQVDYELSVDEGSFGMDGVNDFLPSEGVLVRVDPRHMAPLGALRRHFR